MKRGNYLLAITLLAFTACNNNAATTSNSADSTSHDSTTTTQSVSKLELVFEDSSFQFTGIAKKEGGPLIINYPRWSPKYRYALVNANGNNQVTPYPDSLTNSWQPGQPGATKWVCVQSPVYDDKGTLWVLDPAAPMLKTIQGKGAKLVRMDSAGKFAKTYSFTGILADTAYANDVKFDTKTNFAYITESKGGGIIVVDLTNGKMREVLKAHPSTISDPAYKFIMDGRELMKEGKPAKFNSDGIALTPDGLWLYYKPLSDDKLYRIKTEFLRNMAMAESEIATKVEDLGHFITTDGMIFDQAGNLYLGDLQKNSIVKIDTSLKMTTLVQDNRLIWPDSYAIADGYLYITCSQIQKQPDYNNGIDKRTTPYAVYKLKL